MNWVAFKYRRSSFGSCNNVNTQTDWSEKMEKVWTQHTIPKLIVLGEGKSLGWWVLPFPQVVIPCPWFIWCGTLSHKHLALYDEWVKWVSKVYIYIHIEMKLYILKWNYTYWNEIHPIKKKKMNWHKHCKFELHWIMYLNMFYLHIIYLLCKYFTLHNIILEFDKSPHLNAFDVNTMNCQWSKLPRLRIRRL